MSEFNSVRHRVLKEMDERIWRCETLRKFVFKEKLNKIEKEFIKNQIKEWLK